MDDLLIGDAERDAAVQSLTTAFVAGKLTAEELDERTTSVLQARTETDLVRPLRGLRPAVAISFPPPRPVQPRSWDGGHFIGIIFLGLAVILSLALLFGLGSDYVESGGDSGSGAVCYIDDEPIDC